MFFDNELFQFLTKKKCDDPSLLKIIADQQERLKKAISQLNLIYEELPQNAKEDRAFTKKLRSIHEGQFKGAFSEAVTNFILKHFKFETYFEPEIRTAVGLVTPDLYSMKPNRTFIVETFSPGKTKEQTKLDSNLSKMYKELSGLEGDCSIIVRGYPTPNQSGDFHQLGQEMQKFLKSHDPDPKILQTLTAERGASLSFYVKERYEDGFGLRVGWVDSQARRNNFYRKILEDLRSKRKKYKFPFVASCVLMPSVWCDEHSFYRALIGDPQMVVSVSLSRESKETIPKPFSTNSYSGFWGFKSPDFHRSHLVQAVLKTHVMWSDSGGIKLVVNLYENPHFLTDLKKEFPGVPDCLRRAENEAGLEQGFYLLEP